MQSARVRLRPISVFLLLGQTQQSLSFFSSQFFFMLVFFHEHSRITGLQGKGGGHLINSLLPLPPASQTLRH